MMRSSLICALLLPLGAWATNAGIHDGEQDDNSSSTFVRSNIKTRGGTVTRFTNLLPDVLLDRDLKGNMPKGGKNGKAPKGKSPKGKKNGKAPKGKSPKGKTPSPTTAAPTEEPSEPIICKDQTAAYCGYSLCWVFNEVAYCKCFVSFGDSFSLPLDTPEGDACTINKLGGDGNGYYVSTYFYVEDPFIASYICPVGSTGAYAQCDGGLCFTSTMDKTFPFFGQLEGDEIICSCPITTAPAQGQTFEFAGSYDPTEKGQAGCDESLFDEYCSTDYTSAGGTPNGITIPVGGPPGSAEFAASTLLGEPVKFNVCKSP